MFRTFAVVTLIVGLTACNKGLTTVQAQSPDPANGNLAPSSSSYPSYPDNGQGADDSAYMADADGQAVETTEPPPPLPDYQQPEIPGDDYYWTPGYWAWGPGGYYWVPGAWVLAPYVGAVWTPPYWDYEGSRYLWHAGYWGTHIGFYGGIDYGFGYTGRGYYGAYWNQGHLNYNRSVTRVSVNIHNTYNYSVPRGSVNRVSYNGGRGGITARPTPQERAVVRDRRMPAVTAQTQHAREASNNRAQFAQGGRLGQGANVVAPRQLNTDYHAPAAQPPAAARVAPQRQQQMRPTPQPTPQQGQQRPADTRFQNRPAAAPQPQPRQAQVTPQRPAPQPQQEQRHEARPENRPAPAPAARPAPAPQVQHEQQQRPAEQPRMREPQQQHAQPAPQQPRPQQPQQQPHPQQAPHPNNQGAHDDHEKK